MAGVSSGRVPTGSTVPLDPPPHPQEQDQALILRARGHVSSHPHEKDQASILRTRGHVSSHPHEQDQASILRTQVMCRRSLICVSPMTIFHALIWYHNLC